MSDIIKNLDQLYEQELNELSVPQSEAIDRCSSLGVKFAEHFSKIADEGINSTNFHHHCAEMQAWWNKAKNTRLKSNNKLISNSNLMDWFFTACDSTMAVVGEKYDEFYNEFIVKLLANKNMTVEECIISVLEERNYLEEGE